MKPGLVAVWEHEMQCAVSACMYLVGLIAELRNLHLNPRPLTLLHMVPQLPPRYM